MTIDIVGEDPVTQEIIKVLSATYGQPHNAGSIHPVRGQQIKQLAPKFNQLGKPIFLLADEDAAGCPPTLISEWLRGQPLSKDMVFRVARTEAEVWLMADRFNFSKWLKVKEALIPKPISNVRQVRSIELPFPCKPSLYMMLNIVPHCKDTKLREALTPRKLAKKGPGYNSSIIPFISSMWNPELARKNSTSLDKSIIRLEEFARRILE